MERTLTVLFRRDASRDKQREQIHYRGFTLFWPDGRPVAVGLDAFCQHGQRLLGLRKYLENCQECLIRLVNFPLASCDEDIRKMPGFRVRRFFLERTGSIGRIHFMDGTPTDACFDMEVDEEEVLEWIGLPWIPDGGQQWFDLAAGPEEVAMQSTTHQKFASCRTS